MAIPKRRKKEEKKKVDLDIYGEESTAIAIDYKSTFNYKKYEIEDIKDELVESEKKIFVSINAIQKNNFIIAENLYEVNKKLANRGTGTYVAWCEEIGITRNKSADLLNAYDIYLKTKNEDALKLPIRVVREINKLSKSEEEISKDDLVSVIGSESPAKAFEEVKERMLHSATNIKDEKEDIIEAEIVKSEEEIRAEMLADIEMDRKDAKERERNLKKLRQRIEEKERVFEERFGEAK